MPLDNKLTVLDFRRGLRASEVNHNFNIIQGWNVNVFVLVDGDWWKDLH